VRRDTNIGALHATGAQLWVLNQLGWLRLDTEAIDGDADELVSATGSVTNESVSDLIALAVTRGLYTPNGKVQMNPTNETVGQQPDELGLSDAEVRRPASGRDSCARRGRNWVQREACQLAKGELFLTRRVEPGRVEPSSERIQVEDRTTVAAAIREPGLLMIVGVADVAGARPRPPRRA
jgi:hypothetical protein